MHIPSLEILGGPRPPELQCANRVHAATLSAPTIYALYVDKESSHYSAFFCIIKKQTKHQNSNKKFTLFNHRRRTIITYRWDWGWNRRAAHNPWGRSTPTRRQHWRRSTPEPASPAKRQHRPHSALPPCFLLRIFPLFSLLALSSSPCGGGSWGWDRLRRANGIRTPCDQGGNSEDEDRGCLGFSQRRDTGSGGNGRRWVGAVRQQLSWEWGSERRRRGELKKLSLLF